MEELMNDENSFIPFIGTISIDFNKFDDKQILEGENSNYIRLNKVKIWQGTPSVKNGTENVRGKGILGFETEYQDVLTGKKINSGSHCGLLNSNDIVTKVLELNNADYIREFHLCFEDIITYIKFITKQGQILEIGNYEKNLEKKLVFNEDINPHMISYFYGCYNDYGIRAIGCKQILRKKYIFMHLFGIFQLRHLLKTDENKKNLYSDKSELKKLSLEMEAVARLCLLPDSTFFSIISFYQW